MDAVILAAGKGVRLQPYTLTTPKPLLEVQGRPILDHLLGALPDAIDRIIVVIHHLGEQLEAYLEKQSFFKDWIAVPQGEARGTGDALRRCQNVIRSDRFMVLNGDDLYGHEDLRRLSLVQAGLLVKAVHDPSLWGIAFKNKAGMLDRLEEKPKGLAGPQLANIGAYLFPRKVFEHELQLSPRGEYEITDYVSYLAARLPVEVLETTFWFPIGNVEAWKSAQHLPLPKPRFLAR